MPSHQRGYNQCSGGCGKYIESTRHMDGVSVYCDDCQRKNLSSGGTTVTERNQLMIDMRTYIREAVLHVARGNHPRSVVQTMLKRIREDTDVEVSDDKSGGDAAEMLDDLTVGMVGPDPIGDTGEPPQGAAENEPIKVPCPGVDTPDEDPGQAGVKVKSAPTDGAENEFSVENWRRDARTVLDRHLKEDDYDGDMDGDDDMDDDEGEKKKKKEKDESRRSRSRIREEDDDYDDDDMDDDDEKKKKKDETRRLRGRRIREKGDKDDMPDFIKKKMKDGDDDEKKKEKDEARRRRGGLREQDGSYQIGVPVIYSPKSGGSGGPARVGHKFFHGQGYTYMLEVEGVGTMLAEEDEIQDSPETPEGHKAVT